MSEEKRFSGMKEVEVQHGDLPSDVAARIGAKSISLPFGGLTLTSENPSPTLPDGPVEVACVKRNGQYHVVLRSRVAGKVEEATIKSHDDRRILADRIQAVILEVFK